MVLADIYKQSHKLETIQIPTPRCNLYDLIELYGCIIDWVHLSCQSQCIKWFKYKHKHHVKYVTL